MNAEQRLLVVGIYINSALYLTGCFVAGLVLGNGLAWRCAIASAGLSYIAYALQVTRQPRRLQSLVVIVSFAVGMAAGLALLG